MVFIIVAPGFIFRCQDFANLLTTVQAAVVILRTFAGSAKEVASPQTLLRMVKKDKAGARALFQFALSLHANKRSRPSIRRVLANPTKLFAKHALEEASHLYKMCRLRAVPPVQSALIIKGSTALGGQIVAN